jgi:uncharacterized membrane protein AbrB (regulator of aidB expression)
MAINANPRMGSPAVVLLVAVLLAFLSLTSAQTNNTAAVGASAGAALKVRALEWELLTRNLAAVPIDVARDRMLHNIS